MTTKLATPASGASARSAPLSAAIMALPLRPGEPGAAWRAIAPRGSGTAGAVRDCGREVPDPPRPPPSPLEPQGHATPRSRQDRIPCGRRRPERYPRSAARRPLPSRAATATASERKRGLHEICGCLLEHHNRLWSTPPLGDCGRLEGASQAGTCETPSTPGGRSRIGAGRRRRQLDAPAHDRHKGDARVRLRNASRAGKHSGRGSPACGGTSERPRYPDPAR